jgi:alkylated DNA repair dioxygenase AlkB
MLTVTNTGQVSGDYWHLVGRANSDMEKAWGERREQERAAQYQEAYDMQHATREIREANETTQDDYMVQRFNRRGKKMTNRRYDWELIDPVVEHHRSKGLTWGEISQLLGIKMDSMKSHWHKKRKAEGCI